METIVESSPEGITRAAAILGNGGLVAFPTETVYGLGANAAEAGAVGRVFAAKGRPADHPLIVHLASASAIDRWARDIPAVAWQLAARFWPGPLTLILKAAPGVLREVTGGQDSIGLRVPAHPAALALLYAFGGGLAAPSANRFGRLSPTSAAHVVAELGSAVDCVVDGGACSLGIESTILDLSGKAPRILRPGTLGAQDLAETLGSMPAGPGANAPRAPGGLPAHYAPATPLCLVDAEGLSATAERFARAGRAVLVLAHSRTPEKVGGIRWWMMPAQPAAYARLLYQRLRDVDALGGSCVLVERPPDSEDWEAIRDRLERAATQGGRQKVMV